MNKLSSKKSEYLYTNFPQINTWDGPKGIEKVLNIVNPILLTKKNIIFNFKNCDFLSAEAIAILVGTKLLRKKMGLESSIDIDTLKGKIKKFLRKTRCLEFFGYYPPRWTDNSIPIYVQQKFIKRDITDYIEREIFQRKEITTMSDILQKEIRKAFFELFENIFYHSESPIGGLVCGQVYPFDKKIQIVFYDEGIGISNRVRKSCSSIKSDIEAIKWALQRGTSTLSNNIEARGLGLFLLREFIRANKGNFRIYSNQVLVEEINVSLNCKTLSNNLNGTLIDIRINIHPNIKYVIMN